MSGGPVDFSALPDVAALHPELDEEERVFAAHMKAREDAFAHVFGPSEPPDQILSPGDAELTANWPGGGVYAFPPRGERKGWHYVTHGLAQPFEDPDDEDGEQEEEHVHGPDCDHEHELVSGLGIELVVSTPDKSDWAPLLLLDFVRYLLFNEDARLIVPGDRVPTTAIATYVPGSELGGVIATTSDEYAHHLLLPAGECTLVHLVGVTGTELARARALTGAAGTFVLGEVLRELGPGYLTDAKRACLTKDERFDAAWTEVAKSVEEG